MTSEDKALIADRVRLEVGRYVCPPGAVIGTPFWDDTGFFRRHPDAFGAVVAAALVPGILWLFGLLSDSLHRGFHDSLPD